jgi:precorrin-2 methylase
VFGAADPDAKARRLARALVSDIVVYHPERRERSMAAGSLRQEFREEIQKSWEEYAAQVGEALAKKTPHFRDALNEILAGGQRVF